jgi:hypothetical protein
MPLKLHLGATDDPEPYGDHKPASSVLDILQAKYGLVSAFVKLHEQGARSRSAHAGR